MKLIIDIPEEKYKAITEMYETFPKDMKDWGLEAIKNGTTVEMAEDCISREQAIRATYGFERYTGIDEAPYEYAESVLRDLPPVTPQPKMGKWIEHEDGGYDCSNCCEHFSYNHYHYCPYCGAKMDANMREVQDD